MFGGMPGKSALDNARQHLSPSCLVKVDIAKFYPSVRSERIYRLFCGLGCSPEISRLLTRLTTFRYRLPQGSPTSASLANLVLLFDGVVHRFEQLARQHGATVTFYVDDISISGSPHLEKLASLLEKMISQSGFRPKRTKTTVFRQGDEMVVTGVRVDRGIAAPSSKIDAVKGTIAAYKNGLFGCQPGRPRVALRASLHGKIKHLEGLSPGLSDELWASYNEIDWDKAETPQ